MSDDYKFDKWHSYGRLLNGVVVPCTMLEWAVMFEDFRNRTVASDHISGAHVSTVFLGLNHGYGVRPLWFETMVFDLTMHDPKAELQWRYETLAQAKDGHARACAWVNEHLEVLRAERREALLRDVAPTPKSPSPLDP